MPNGFFYENIWAGACLMDGMYDCFFYYYRVLYKLLYLMQTASTLIRRRILPRLIWVYTICQCPFYGTTGIMGLNYINWFVFVKETGYTDTVHTSRSLDTPGRFSTIFKIYTTLVTSFLLFCTPSHLSKEVYS